MEARDNHVASGGETRSIPKPRGVKAAHLTCNDELAALTGTFRGGGLA